MSTNDPFPHLQSRARVSSRPCHCTTQHPLCGDICSREACTLIDRHCRYLTRRLEHLTSRCASRLTYRFATTKRTFIHDCSGLVSHRISRLRRRSHKSPCMPIEFLSGRALNDPPGKFYDAARLRYVSRLQKPRTYNSEQPD